MVNRALVGVAGAAKDLVAVLAVTKAMRAVDAGNPAYRAGLSGRRNPQPRPGDQVVLSSVAPQVSRLPRPLAQRPVAAACAIRRPSVSRPAGALSRQASAVQQYDAPVIPAGQATQQAAAPVWATPVTQPAASAPRPDHLPNALQPRPSQGLLVDMLG